MRCEFCTLFDSRYLARGLVLYRSLAAHCEDFRLHVFCMDDESRELLTRLELPRLRIIGIDDVEQADPELAATRAGRTPWEYCWTAAPAICRYVLEREPDIEVLTYLDADLCLWSSPAPLFEELGDGSVLLVPHRGSHAHDRTVGVYNVGWVSFRNDARGREALWWWRERCIEWCYDRPEPGRYADQKYLEELPRRFGGVRVLANVGGGVGPWNVSQYRLEAGNGSPRLDGAPVVFHHFQSLELYAATTGSRLLARHSRAFRLTPGPVPLVWTAGWRLTEHHLALLWEPYAARLSEAMAEVGGAESLDDVSAARAAFHLARRHVPAGVRGRYWKMRKAIWRRRMHRGLGRTS